MENNKLSLASPECLPGGVQSILFVSTGDDVFDLKPSMMKPHPQQNLTTEKKLYNCKDSTERRISENLFSILASRWGIYHMLMNLQPKAAEGLIFAILALHNMLMTSPVRGMHCPAGLAYAEDVDQELTQSCWRNNNCVQSMGKMLIV